MSKMLVNESESDIRKSCNRNRNIKFKVYTVYSINNTGYIEYSEYTKIELQGLVYVYEYE